MPASLEFTIEGMDCADCARTVEKAVASLPGVGSATVNFGAARLTVLPATEPPDGLAGRIEHKVGEAGYRAMPLRSRIGLEREPFWRRERRVLYGAVGLVASLAAFVLHFTSLPAWVGNALYAVAIAVAGHTFARAGLLSLRAGRADMNLLMTVAVVGAAAIGDWGEAATVVLLFAFGGTLQVYTLERTRDGIRALMDLSPTTARVRRVERQGGLPVVREVRLPVEDVESGEVLVVGPGERLPLDGQVIEGASSIDQSPITGESVPVDVESGAEVFAGTINGPGVLHVRVTRTSGDTALARIISMVEEAQAKRAPSQQLVDRFSAVYTPLVIVGALLVALVPPLAVGAPFGDWFYRALVLLVVSCPCALVISTPVSIVAAIGAAARRGVLIKGGAALEALGRTGVVAFDKTGTLTQGRPQVVGAYPLEGSESDLLALAAAVEARSEHPLARAIAHSSRNGAAKLHSSGFTALPGLGARAVVDGREALVGNTRLMREQGLALNGASSLVQRLEDDGKTAVLVASEGQVLGVIALADTPRPEAREALMRLNEAGVGSIAMLTGDNERTARSIAAQIGVTEVRAELLPDEKVEAVSALRKAHGSVAMVGDGVNDAPALALADVGIAMGVAGTDAALEVADIALMGDDLSQLEYAVRLSRRTVSVIRWNIGISLATKGLALGLAAFGALPLWGAILADMGVSLLVTLNGMTLLGFRRREARP